MLQTRSASQCQGMEPTFYEDTRFRNREEVRGMKRPMTLDLNAVKSSKKPRGNSLLTSPDLQLLKLESPELEKLIIQQHGMAQNQCMYPKVDNRDQYPRDFPDALGGLQHHGNTNYNLYQPPQTIQSDVNILSVSNNCNIMPPSTMTTASMVDSYGYQPISTMNGNCNPMVSSTMSSNCYAPINNGYGYTMEPMVSIKEEPQTVPCASPPDPPRSPIDMEDQERLKLERKRLRNRIAASKCRRRKLEKIARLEDRVSLLKSENSELLNKVTFLKDQVCHLKQQVLEHVRSGCDILTNTSYPSYGEEL